MDVSSLWADGSDGCYIHLLFCSGNKRTVLRGDRPAVLQEMVCVLCCWLWVLPTSSTQRPWHRAAPAWSVLLRTSQRHSRAVGAVLCCWRLLVVLGGKGLKTGLVGQGRAGQSVVQAGPDCRGEQRSGPLGSWTPLLLWGRGISRCNSDHGGRLCSRGKDGMEVAGRGGSESRPVSAWCEQPHPQLTPSIAPRLREGSGCKQRRARGASCAHGQYQRVERASSA